MNTTSCALSFYRHDEMPSASIKQPLASIAHNTFRHCRVRFYTFVGQPFLKQLKGNMNSKNITVFTI